jgi:uncharacterized lipoprotein YajG
MMKKLAFPLAPILALAACADEPETLPNPDPALVERLAVTNTAATAEIPGKLAKADKLVGAVAHVGPDRIGGAAGKLLAR